MAVNLPKKQFLAIFGSYWTGKPPKMKIFKKKFLILSQ
jgi:hypothetical protein